MKWKEWNGYLPPDVTSSCIFSDKVRPSACNCKRAKITPIGSIRLQSSNARVMWFQQNKSISRWFVCCVADDSDEMGLHRRDSPNIRTLFHADVWYSPWFTLFSADIVPCNIWPSTNQVSRKSLYTKLIQSCRDVSKLFPFPPRGIMLSKKCPKHFGSLSIVRRGNFFHWPPKNKSSENEMQANFESKFSFRHVDISSESPHIFLQEVRLLKVAETAGHKIGGVF